MVDSRYLPRSRQFLSKRSRPPLSGWWWAAPPLVAGLCLAVPLLLVFPRIAEGLSEGEAVG
jgi:hypothetical protein